MLKKAIHKSQHCNRNWDLSKSIPQEDIDLILESAVQCPVKQNLNYYKTHVFTDRESIEKIHSYTEGIMAENSNTGERKEITNSQTLANMVMVFTKDSPTYVREAAEVNNPEADTYKEDRIMSVGIASAYVNYTASLLGYETGCCKCFDGEGLTSLFNGEQPLLIMGIGYPDKTRSRLEHHQDSSWKMPTMPNKRQSVVHTAA